LHGISKVSFRSFLCALYPFCKGAAATTYDEWIAALDLAIMWDFKEIRKACIEALSELIKSRNIFDSILLAKKYKVKKWLRYGYFRLYDEKELELKLGDNSDIPETDLVNIVKILHIQERRHRELQVVCTHCIPLDHHYFSNEAIINEIETVIADEMVGMQDD